MTNVLASVRFNVDVSADKVERLVGYPDDGSEEFYERACQAVEGAIADDPIQWLELAGPPDVEVD